MDDDPKRLSTRIQMLATLVATATYAAGFNPPGGVWQDINDAAGHLPGDPIMLSTHYLRYVVFFYCNAIAFTLSLIVVVVTLFVTTYPKGTRKEIKWYLAILMSAAMVAFTVAYGAGACRTKLTIVWYSIQVPFPFFFVMYLAFARWKLHEEEEKKEKEKDKEKEHEEKEKMETELKEQDYFRAFQRLVVPLSMFALTITYVAGLSTPGGFWDSAEGGHRPGDAILGDRFQGRTLKWFLTLNTTAFLASLYALSLLIVHVKKLRTRLPLFCLLALLYLLIGLLGAYIVGNSRGRVNWPLYGEVFACMVVYVVIHVIFMKTTSHKVPILAGKVRSRLAAAAKVCLRLAGEVRSRLAAAGKVCSRLAGEVSRKLMQMLCRCAAGSEDEEESATAEDQRRQPDPAISENNEVATGQQRRNDDAEKEENNRRRRRRRAYLVQLMAGLAVAITYQAGLYPPGGLWADNADGHTAGDPILLATNARRYRGFYYCNSVSFVASLLAMFLVQQKNFHEHHALEAAMLLDMLGLVGAYAIGSCRDQVSTLYVAGLAGAGVVYVFVHVSYFTLGDDTGDKEAGREEDGVENMGGRFLLFAVLVASITYQAGLTPPGGFLLKDDARSGHHAGDPVLLYNYPRRYRAFFYCNSVSFMLSIVLIVLLVNPNQYRIAIQSHALTVCSAVSYVCLMGAFAAGSTQHLKGSYFIFALAGLPSLFSAILFFKYWDNRRMKSDDSGSNQQSSNSKEKYSKRNEYLMTLAILVASANYPAGLDPPGGSWQSSSDGHDAGNPVMHDNRRHRYLAFFVGNTASFLASVMLILVLLFAMHEKTPQDRHEETPQDRHKETPQGQETPQDRHEETPQGQETPQDRHKETPQHKETSRQYRKWVNGGLVSLQGLGFLVAYAAGSSRRWKTSAHIGTLVSAVLLFVAIHVGLSVYRKLRKDKQRRGQRSDHGEVHTVAQKAPVEQV